MAGITAAPVNFPIVWNVGTTLSIQGTVTDTNSSLYDFTSATITTSITTQAGAAAIVPTFTTSTPSPTNGVFILSLTTAQLTSLLSVTGNYLYSVAVTRSGVTTEWLAGSFTVQAATTGGTASAPAFTLTLTTSSITLALSGVTQGTAANITVTDTAGFLTTTPKTAETAIKDLAAVNALVFDHFDRYSNGGLATNVPLIGPTWRTSGSGLPAVTSGLLGSASNGYSYMDCVTTPQTLSAGVRFTNPDTNNTATMAWMTGASGTAFQVNDIGCHCNFGPTNYTITICQNGVFYTLMSGTWTNPMVAGVTYPIAVTINGGRLTIQANGDTRTSAYDIRLTSLPGPVVWWQTTVVSSASANFVWVMAAAAPTGLVAPPGTVNARDTGVTTYQRGQAVGNVETGGQVNIGYSTQDNVSPGINFGPSTIRTQLSTAVTIGGSTFVSPLAMPTGTSVLVEGGTNTETVTTTGFPTGSGPFTHTITTTFANNHAAGVVLVGTPTATFRGTMYMSASNGFFFLPNQSVVCAPGGNMYLGSALDTFLRRVSADVAGMGAGDSFQVDGVWNTGRLIMGAFHLWVDGSGRLRIKSGAPTSDTDGTVVGTQV